MNTSEQIKEIELSIEQAKSMVSLEDALNRLYANKDFQQVIVQNYLKDEAIRLVHLKSSPQMDTASHQENIIKQIDAIGNFLSYLQTITYMGQQAQLTIDEYNQAKQDILFEDAQMGD